MYFSFNGVSSKDLGLKVKDFLYDILPKRRVSETINPKYDGTLYNDEETYESYVIDIECVLVDNFNIGTIKKIKDVFKSGKGELTLSHKPNNIYDVRLNNTINFLEMLNITGSCILSFKVEPFSLLKSGKTPINASTTTTIKNLGNCYSMPIYKVLNPSATVTITINGSRMEFTGVTKPFIVDTYREDVYSVSGENLNTYMSLQSDFIPFKEGDNVVEFVGASGLEITPNWREL